MSRLIAWIDERLPLTKFVKIISEYSERIFERESFQESLTESEKELF